MSSSFRGVLFCGVALVVASAARAQDTEQEKFVVIKAGRVITMAGPELRNVDILLVDGKVRLVGTGLAYPKAAKVIDARQQLVMPGMIHPHTRWQLPAHSRSGVHGDRSAGKEVTLSEIDFQPFLKAGFTTVGFYPTGMGIPGVCAVYRVAGTDDDRTLGEGYLRITMASTGRDKKVLRDAVKKARLEIAKVEKARKEWDEKQKQKKAKAEAARKTATKKTAAEQGKKEVPKKEQSDSPEKKLPPSMTAKKDGKSESEKTKKSDADAAASKKPDVFVPPKIDPAVMPLVRWIRDKKGPPLLYELRSAGNYLHLQDVLKQAKELPQSAICVTDSTRSNMHYVLKDLGKRRTMVLLPTGIGTLPSTATRVNLAAELVLAGCEIALMPKRDSESELARFRTQLADLVRAGVPRGEVLQAVTLRPAKMLGIDKLVGSIEKGKSADLIFLDGDPLAPGSTVQRVMVSGEFVWEAE